MQAPVPFSASNTTALANFLLKIHFSCTENTCNATCLNPFLSSLLSCQLTAALTVFHGLINIAAAQQELL